MGQYYVLVNLDRREYVHPHRVGSGLKLWEICSGNLPRLLCYLLRQSTGRGGGDPTVSYREFEEDGDVDWAAWDDAVREAFPNQGRWAGDRVLLAGDYDESEVFQGLYREVQDSEVWTEVSHLVAEEFNRFIGSEERMVREPEDPEECGHENTSRTVDETGRLVRERCLDCQEVLRGGDR